jgi:hypothetical protein
VEAGGAAPAFDCTAGVLPAEGVKLLDGVPVEVGVDALSAGVGVAAPPGVFRGFRSRLSLRLSGMSAGTNGVALPPAGVCLAVEGVGLSVAGAVGLALAVGEGDAIALLLPPVGVVPGAAVEAGWLRRSRIASGISFGTNGVAR